MVVALRSTAGPAVQPGTHCLDVAGVEIAGGCGGDHCDYGFVDAAVLDYACHTDRTQMYRQAVVRAM